MSDKRERIIFYSGAEADKRRLAWLILASFLACVLILMVTAHWAEPAGGQEPAGVDDVCPLTDFDPETGGWVGHFFPSTEGEVEAHIVAPTGWVIDMACIKAGSANQGDGPEFITFDPPVTEATISHSSGKEWSHLSVHKIRPPATTTTSTTVPEETTTTTVPEETTTTTTPEETTTTTVPSSTTSTAPVPPDPDHPTPPTPTSRTELPNTGGGAPPWLVVVAAIAGFLLGAGIVTHQVNRKLEAYLRDNYPDVGAS